MSNTGENLVNSTPPPMSERQAPPPDRKPTSGRPPRGKNLAAPKGTRDKTSLPTAVPISVRMFLAFCNDFFTMLFLIIPAPQAITREEIVSCIAALLHARMAMCHRRVVGLPELWIDRRIDVQSRWIGMLKNFGSHLPSPVARAMRLVGSFQFQGVEFVPFYDMHDDEIYNPVLAVDHPTWVHFISAMRVLNRYGICEDFDLTSGDGSPALLAQIDGNNVYSVYDVSAFKFDAVYGFGEVREHPAPPGTIPSYLRAPFPASVPYVWRVETAIERHRLASEFTLSTLNSN